MSEKSPAYPLVYVQWLDSSRRVEWSEIATSKTADLRCVSVGWLIRDCDDFVEVAPHLSTVLGEFRHSVGSMIIPRCAITDLWYLETT